MTELEITQPDEIPESADAAETIESNKSFRKMTNQAYLNVTVVQVEAES